MFDHEKSSSLATIELLNQHLDSIEKFHIEHTNPAVAKSSNEYEMPGGAVTAVCTSGAGKLSPSVPIIIDKLEWYDDTDTLSDAKRVGYIVKGRGHLPAISLRAKRITGDWVIKIRLGIDARVENFEAFGEAFNGEEEPIHPIMLEQIMSMFANQPDRQ